MKNRGFTLVELLGVIALLAAVMLLVYPNVLEKVQEKENDIVEKKQKIVYNAAYDYLYENKADYPIRAGKVYCLNMGYLASLDKLPVDEYNDILKDSDVSKNYIKVSIGDDDNSYRIITSTTSCTDGIIEG